MTEGTPRSFTDAIPASLADKEHEVTLTYQDSFTILLALGYLAGAGLCTREAIGRIGEKVSPTQTPESS